MTKQQYVNQILRRIRATARTRQRIRTDLLADIAAKEEAGLPFAQIQAEMGSPDKVAAEFNAAFADTDAAVWYRRQRAAGVLAIVLAVIAAVLAVPGIASVVFLLAPTVSVGFIGGADGPTSVFVAGGADNPISVNVAGMTVTGVGPAPLLILAGLPLLLAVLAAACLVAWLIFRRHRS